MHVGITGGRGVLGRILQVQLAAAGHRHDCFGGDVRESKDLAAWMHPRRFDAIIHLAALVPTQSVQTDPARAFQVNVGGTANLIAAVSAYKPWIFYASSSHVYQPQEAPLSESAPTAPAHPYGVSKLMGERVLAACAPAVGLDYCVGRIFSFYHPSQAGSFLYPSLLRRFVDEDLEKPFSLFGAEDIRDISPAEVLVAHIVTLAEKRATGVVNIGSGQGTRIADFAQAHAPRPLKVVNASTVPPTSLVADISHLYQLLGR